MDQGGVESEAKECRKMALYSPGAPVTCTWAPRNMDQGGVESEAKECRKMALYSPGTPVTWTGED
jgi:hypothetical protein